MLAIQPRSTWGAADPVVSRLQPHSGALRFVTVHHAGDTTGITGPPRYRGWQRFHVEDRGWGDIAYHLIVGVDGTVYEGRTAAFRGDTATTYDPDRHFLVVVEGNFDTGDPTPDQLEMLPVVVAWAAGANGVPLTGIAGHRDYARTSCPGAGLYPYVTDGLRTDVEALIAAGGVALA